MPSAKILESKKALVKALNEEITSSLAGVVVAYNGISVADDTKLRKELREAGVHYMVVKNTMLRLAVKGTQYEALTDCFKVTPRLLCLRRTRLLLLASCASLPMPISPSDLLSRVAFCARSGYGRCWRQEPVYHAQPRGSALHAGRLPQRDHRVVWLWPCRLLPTSRKNPLPDFRSSCLSVPAQRSQTLCAA